MSRPPRIAVLAADSRREADGIRDYTAQLVRSLQTSARAEAALFLRRSEGGWRPAGDADWEIAAADAAVLQYNPFWYGRRGFAPGLVRDVARLRRAPASPRVALMVHETYVNMKNLRWTLMGSWQRVQLAALRQLTDLQLCSTESWMRHLTRLPGRAPVHHLPVPSNFPDRRSEAETARAELAPPSGGVVLTCFGLRHPGRLVGHVHAAAGAVAAAGSPATVLNLGPGESAVEEIAPGVSVRSPGYLPEDSIARLLAATDLFLAPYADGVSTRRTTVMSALQHAIPVLGTDGPLTDRVLRESGGALRLVPVTQRDRFAEEAARLAGAVGERRELGDAGRSLYARRFDWPVLVDRLVDLLQAKGR
jgi:glycosyltransferase involved in cell wall biosynthesis